MMNDDDLALLRRLGRALEHADPPPADVLSAARASFAMRDLDGELAALVSDTALDRELVGIRSGGGSRILSFEGEEGGVELQVVDGDEGRVIGQVSPAAPAAVEVIASDGSTMVETDHLGRFAMDRPAPGPVQLRWRSGDRLTRTDWVLL